MVSNVSGRQESDEETRGEKRERGQSKVKSVFPEDQQELVWFEWERISGIVEETGDDSFIRCIMNEGNEVSPKTNFRWGSPEKTD